MARGQSQYLSWIIILTLIISISFVLYRWSVAQAQSTSEELQARSDPVLCSDVDISVDSICQTFRTVEANITNVNNRRVDGIRYSGVGLYPDDPDYLDSKTVYKTIDTGDDEHFSILKKVTLSQVEIVPIVKRGNRDIICEEKAETVEKSKLKQC